MSFSVIFHFIRICVLMFIAFIENFKKTHTQITVLNEYAMEIIDKFQFHGYLSFFLWYKVELTCLKLCISEWFLDWIK